MIYKNRQWSCLFLLLVAPAMLSVASAQESASGDAQRLQGTWIADLEPGLRARLELDGKDLRYVHVRGQRESVIWKGYFSVDEAPRPKQMDWKPLSPGKVPPSLGIYRIEGDLLLVVSSTEGTRPNAFYSGGGSYRPKTVIFRRVQESQSEPSTQTPNE